MTFSFMFGTNLCRRASNKESSDLTHAHASVPSADANAERYLFYDVVQMNEHICDNSNDYQMKIKK